MALDAVIIDRTGASALIPIQYSTEIIAGAVNSSTVMRLARRLPDMISQQTIMPVLDNLIIAGFVNGDTGLKPTAKVAWSNKTITAEELAVIVPIPENVLNDAQYDIWAQVRPLIVAAFGVAIDRAILFGTNKPASWPTGLVAQTIAAGNTVALGSADAYDKIMGVDGVIAKVEEDGFIVNGHLADITMRAKLRGLRADGATGVPLFLPDMQSGGNYTLDGAPMFFPGNGAWDKAVALMLSGDWTNAVYAIRQDITFKLLSESVILNTDGTIAYNLAQQDMVALRAVMRLGWQSANPINQTNPVNATRFPFAVLTPA